MKLLLLAESYAVCRLGPAAPAPEWAWRGAFCSVTRTADELSIVCPQVNVPDGVTAERDWRAFKVKGPLDFGLVGVLAGLATALAAAEISIFALSTYDTDYLLVKGNHLAEAIRALQAAGHNIVH